MSPDLASLALAPAPLDLFRERLLSDPLLTGALGAIEDRDGFAATVMEIAGGMGLALDRDALDATLRSDPLALDRFDHRPAMHRPVPGPAWLPGTVTSATGGLVVDWAHFGGARLTEPFFEESLRWARRRPLNRLLRLRTPLSSLPADMAGEKMAMPDGLIFHLSRCGSTLMAQMLAAARVHVVSEASPLDAVLQLAQARAQVPLAERVGLLRAMVAALGRRPDGGSGPYVIKLDSWHALALPLFRLAFPDTPWLFLYRDPVEVLASHMRSRGWQTIPGVLSNLYGIPEGERIAGEEYTARILARTCEAVLRHQHLGGGMLLNYRMLPGAMETHVLPHFGIRLGAADRAGMAAAAARDAKTPGLPFVRDIERKQQEAGAGLRALASRHLTGPYRRLETIRQGE